MAQTVGNVTAAKPATGGALYRAPSGTTCPTDAVTALADAFKGLGYADEKGLTNSNSPESKDVKAWGGDTVLNLQEEKKDTFKINLIEALNVEVLKAIYGTSHVTGTMSTGLTVEATADPQAEAVWVCEMILNSNTVERVVIPKGVISNVSDIVYSSSDPKGFEITITALPEANGKTHYEYYKQSS